MGSNSTPKKDINSNKEDFEMTLLITGAAEVKEMEYESTRGLHEKKVEDMSDENMKKFKTMFRNKFYLLVMDI